MVLIHGCVNVSPNYLRKTVDLGGPEFPAIFYLVSNFQASIVKDEFFRARF
jgi:hypothetical protein